MVITTKHIRAQYGVVLELLLGLPKTSLVRFSKWTHQQTFTEQSLVRVVYTIMLQKPSIVVSNDRQLWIKRILTNWCLSRGWGVSEQVHEGAAKGPRSWAMQGSKFSSSDLTRDEDHMNFFEEQWEQHFAGTTNEDVDENTLEHDVPLPRQRCRPSSKLMLGARARFIISTWLH